MAKIILMSMGLAFSIVMTVPAADLSAGGTPYDHPDTITMSATDQIAGEKLYSVKGCIECHGPRGYSVEPGMFPNVAGLDREYIVEQLTAFRSGVRQNVIMSPVAETLTPDDIAAIAAFLTVRP